MGFTSNLSFVRLRPAINAAANMTVSAGVAFIIATTVGNSTPAIQVHAPNTGTSTGKLVFNVTSSGATTQSGSATIRGTLSGAGLKMDGGKISVTANGLGHMTLRTASAASIIFTGEGMTGGTVACIKATGALGHCVGITIATGKCTCD